MSGVLIHSQVKSSVDADFSPRTFCLWNRPRSRQGADTADGLCAGRKTRSKNDKLIPLSRCRAAGHALAGKRIAVGVRCRVSVAESFEKGHDLVLLMISQAEVTERHIDVV